MFDFIPTETIEAKAYGQPLRITMRAVGSLGYAKFDEIRVRLLGRAEEFGADAGMANVATYRKGRAVYRTAALFVSLAMLERQDGDAWRDLGKPEDYADLGDLPDEVLNACEAVYCRLNPGLFFNYAEYESSFTDEGEPEPAEDADQKKDETPTETDLLTTPSA